MSLLPYPGQIIKEQIILYVTEKMSIAKNTECTQGLSIKTVSSRDTLIYHVISYILLVT